MAQVPHAEAYHALDEQTGKTYVRGYMPARVRRGFDMRKFCVATGQRLRVTSQPNGSDHSLRVLNVDKCTGCTLPILVADKVQMLR